MEPPLPPPPTDPEEPVQLQALHSLAAAAQSHVKGFSQSSSAAPSKPPQCVDCKIAIDEANKSALPAYCQKCFVCERRLSAQQKPVEKAADPYKTCNLCCAALSGDNKSPVVGVCHPCYVDEAKVAGLDAMDVEDTFILPQDHVAPDAALTSESSKLTQNDVAGTDCKEPGAGDPPHGWERRAKKSQQHWYARICAFRDGGQKRKQADYVAKWKAMTNGQQDAFRREVTAKLSNTGSAAALECQPNKTLLPWEVESDAGRMIQLPQGYTTDDLVRDFEQYSHHPAGHDQKRWEMYGLLHLLLKDAGTKLQKPATAESELKALKINKKQLQLS